MKKILTFLTSDWHASRIFRVVTGAAAIVFALVKHDSLMGLAGGLLLLTGISNVGCGSGGCKTKKSS
jgi:hypothetical protein